MGDTAQIVPRGPFSLPAAAGFGFGPNEGRPPPFDGAMRLAFPIDGGTGYAGAILRQPEPDGPVQVELELRETGDAESAVAQIARVISLDHDGEEFLEVGSRDPAIGVLQRAHPGQRPVLFHSPYEGAAWAIISARRPAAQGASVRNELGERLGASFELAGRTLQAFPQPEALAGLENFPGLGADKVERLRGVAQAASEGALDLAHLHKLGPERAYDEVQQLKGIGPFYAGLVVLRACGFADAMLATPEPKVLRNAARLYGLDAPPTLAELAERAESWRPFRTWVTVLIRLAGDRGTF
ncbi:MAG: DNA-3-methyladenine glycosylase 2 family protein [Actinomycetota bacterium]|nr:DNA-3-methyladenine glycosylase 2 family protein [Actinomycetota bacterium]